MEKYRDFETLLANVDHYKLFCMVDEIVFDEAAANADRFDGYEDAEENDDLDSFVMDVATDERMSGIICESLQFFFTDELAALGQLHPESEKLYRWYREY